MVKSSQDFAMQVDDYKDVGGVFSVLLAFVRYNNRVEQEIRMCRHLPTHTTVADIFNLIDLYMAG
jgi:hypothetical protein